MQNPTSKYDELEVQYLDGEGFDVPRRYALQETRGKGSYGVVVAAKNVLTGELVAIKKNKTVFPVYKTVSKKTSTSMDDDSEEEEIVEISSEHPHRSKTSQTRILRELKILIHLNHPNITALKDVLKPRSLNEFTDLYIVTDLMEADLRDIVESDQTLSNEHIQYFMYQILIAMNYIHSADILHRDLKPENILLNSNCELKLCDFGLARGLDFSNEDTDPPTMSTSYVQTRWYRAPELLLDNPKVNKTVDIWSIGCIFGELLGRKVLFRGKNHIDQLTRVIQIMGTPKEEDIKAATSEGKNFVLHGVPFSHGVPFEKMFPNATPLARDLLKKMLHFNPNKRITAEQALKHPYFKNIYHKDHIQTCPNKFDFSFEEEIKKKGIKEVCYETIMQFHQDRKSQQEKAEIQKKMMETKMVTDEEEQPSKENKNFWTDS